VTAVAAVAVAAGAEGGSLFSLVGEVGASGTGVVEARQMLMGRADMCSFVGRNIGPAPKRATAGRWTA